MDFSALGQLGPGMDQGLTLAAKIQAMQQAQQAQQARGAVGRMLMGPPPGMGGAPPMPPSAMPQPPMPGQASMPSQPMNSMDLAAAQDPSGMPPMPLPDTGGAPPMPQAMGPPPMPEPTGATGEPLAGNAAPSGDVVKDAQSTITNIANQIHAANPDITPEQLFDATNLHIEQMKGVRNDVRDYMMAQVELAKAQTRVQTTEIRVQGQKDVAGINAGARVEAAGINSDSRRDVAKTNAGARTEAAQITGGSRERVAASSAGARVEAAKVGAGSREKVAETNAGASDYRADQGYRGKVDSATAYNGGKTFTKPGPARARPAASGAPSRGNSWTPESLKAAVTSGKLTRQQGEQIARANGYIR